MWRPLFITVMALCVAGCRFGVDGLAGSSDSPGGVAAPIGDDGGAPAPVDLAGADPASAPDLAMPAPPTKPGPGTPTPGALGDACDPMHPCSTGLNCYDSLGQGNPINQPGGICSMDCTSTACPSGSKCIKYQGQAICLIDCNPLGPNMCRMGWSCCSQLAACGPGPVCGPQGGQQD